VQDGYTPQQFINMLDTLWLDEQSNDSMQPFFSISAQHNMLLQDENL